MTQARSDTGYEEILQGCLEAVDEEVEAVREELERRGLESPLVGRGGRLREGAGSGFVYEWRLADGDVDVRVDDAVRVRTEASEALGFVTGFRRADASLRVASAEWLGREPGPAELEFDPTWLLMALRDRLEAMREEPDRFHPETVLKIFGRVYPELGRQDPELPATADLNPSQRDALARLLGSDVHYVWGPPGTGKTRLLGHAVAELTRQGSVLVASTTNGAVDEAAERVAEVLGGEAVRANRVIRVGAEFSLTGNPDLSLDAAVERRVRGGRLEEELDRLESRLLTDSRRRGRRRGRRESFRSRHRRLVSAARTREDEEALRDLLTIGSELGRETSRVLRDADVVLTTFARLAAWEELSSLRFRSVVVDEASTAPLPYVAVAAAQASHRAVAIGDFQQLPSVVTSRGERAERWFSRDAFREAGIVQDTVPGETSLPGEHDKLCAMLVEQYRMAPQVRSLVSDLFYDGRLTDAPEVLERSLPAASLVLLDTSSLEPSVERVEGSRANAEHVEAVVRFVELTAREGMSDVGVVAPYRVQARRIWKLTRTRLGRSAPEGLEVSTIHRFQGREKRVVIFDTVDAPPDRSWFLHEGRNRDFPRLLNVALSRTRDLLVVVGTPEGLEETLPEDALLNRVVARIQRDGVTVDARGLEDTSRLFRAPAGVS